MNKLFIFGLLVMLVVVAGCAQKSAEQASTVPTTSVGPAETGETGALDAGASEMDALDSDLASEDVDKQLADINPDEVKDINF